MADDVSLNQVLHGNIEERELENGNGNGGDGNGGHGEAGADDGGEPGPDIEPPAPTVH